MAQKKRKKESQKPIRPAEAPNAFIRYEGCSLWAVALYHIFSIYFGTSQVSARRNYPLTEGEMDNLGGKYNTPRSRIISFKMGMLDYSLSVPKNSLGRIDENHYPIGAFSGMSGFTQLLTVFLNAGIFACFLAIIGFLIIKF